MIINRFLFLCGLYLLACTNSSEQTVIKSKPIVVSEYFVQEDFPFGALLYAVKNNGSIYSFTDRQTCAVYLYSYKGKLIRQITKNDLPYNESCPRSIHVSGDTLFAYYPDARKIAFFSWPEFEFLKYINVQFPDSYIPQKRAFFEFDEKNKNFYLPTASNYSLKFDEALFDGMATKEYMASQKAVSVFNSEGEYLRSFGKVPDLFLRGGVDNGSSYFYQLLKADSQLFIKYALNPTTEIYNMEGKNLQMNDLFLPEMEYNYNVKNASGRGGWNDSYLGMAIETGKDGITFYYHIIALSSGKPHIYVYKFIPSQDKLFEYELEAGNYFMFPYTQNDTVSFIKSDFSSDEKKIIHMVFD